MFSTKHISNKKGGDEVNKLTPREIEILGLFAEGFSNKEVAHTFELSVRTVEAHRLSIRSKTHANSLSDLVRIAKTLGLVMTQSREIRSLRC